jgi:hydrogenase maturation protease
LRRIICIGNALLPSDDAGPRMYVHLLQEPLPQDVELVDGGTRGLDLLPFFDGARLVVLIDQVEGFCPAPGVVLLQGEELLRATQRRYDHQIGIGYLLQLLPQVCDIAAPEVRMIGIEGCLDEKNTQLCLRILRLQLNG